MLRTSGSNLVQYKAARNNAVTVTLTFTTTKSWLGPFIPPSREPPRSLLWPFARLCRQYSSPLSYRRKSAPIFAVCCKDSFLRTQTYRSPAQIQVSFLSFEFFFVINIILSLTRCKIYIFIAFICLNKQANLFLQIIRNKGSSSICRWKQKYFIIRITFDVRTCAIKIKSD